MRRKFLIAIVSFLLVSMGMTSCLGSDDSYTASTDPTVHAFSLDTIRGVNYPFAIDQLNRLIYNIDSLPVYSDTIIDSILITSFSVTGYITSGDLDTIFNIGNYQDLRGATSEEGLHFRIHAADMTTYRDYTLRISIHQQDPDSLQWSEPFTLPLPTTTGKAQRAMAWNDELWLYVSDREAPAEVLAYRTAIPSIGSWEEVRTDLPAGSDVSSVCKVGEALYMMTAAGDLYSTANGINWTREDSLSGAVETLIGGYRDRLLAIVRADGASYFASAVAGDRAWERLDAEPVPDDFPRENIYATNFQTANGIDQLMLTGIESGERIIPWAYDGLRWAKMDPETSYDVYCLTHETGRRPAIIYYGDRFYLFGERMNCIYTSVAGLSWSKTTGKFLLPGDIVKGSDTFSLTVDDEHYIYIVISKPDGTAYNIWRGRLNRLGFARQ